MDYGRIVGFNPIWVQTNLAEMVGMLKRVGLQTNMVKTKAMVFTLGFIRVQ